MEEVIKKPKCKLIGTDGNAFAIMGNVRRSLTRAGFSKEYVDKVLKEMMSGDYDNLLRVAGKYCDIY